MKKIFSWLKSWFLAIGGCFSSTLETKYILGDNEIVKCIKNPSELSDELNWE